MLGDEVIGTGTGSSKRKAQLAAAEAGWKALDGRKGGAEDGTRGKSHKSHHKSHHKAKESAADSSQNSR